MLSFIFQQRRHRPSLASSQRPCRFRLAARFLRSATARHRVIPTAPSPPPSNLHLWNPRGGQRRVSHPCSATQCHSPDFYCHVRFALRKTLLLVLTAKLGLRTVLWGSKDGSRRGNAWESAGEESGERLHAMSAIETKSKFVYLFSCVTKANGMSCGSQPGHIEILIHALLLSYNVY